MKLVDKESGFQCQERASRVDKVGVDVLDFVQNRRFKNSDVVPEQVVQLGVSQQVSAMCNPFENHFQRLFR